MCFNFSLVLELGPYCVPETDRLPESQFTYLCNGDNIVRLGD